MINEVKSVLVKGTSQYLAFDDCDLTFAANALI